VSAILVSTHADRDEAHRALAEAIAGAYPLAECRETSGSVEVWSGSREPEPVATDVGERERSEAMRAAAIAATTTPAVDLDALATLIAAKLKGGT
jgi:hypothetical protein